MFNLKTKEIGIVIAINGNMAKVKASRHNDCDNCGACPGSSAIIIDAENPIGAQPGQRVNFVVEQVNVLLAAFIVYIFPMILTMIGIFLSAYIADQRGISETTNWMIGGGIISFILALLLIKIYESWARKKTAMLPTIMEIA